ncbi:MAG TPA: sulfurtransferase [Pirellulales bacterium]|jgi:thiosulfate/3-mercaptopyruvate sulfurtransferase|nr:sulfurtransferase [Pirellulales bacterium]
MAKYAFPEVLVSTQWVAEHQQDAQIRIVESDEDPLVYQQGHIPGAVRLDWHTELENPVIRDFVDKEHFETVMRSKGIANDTTVVFYGDKSNWWACYAFWVFKLYGHEKCLIMDGGRKRWELDGKPLVRDPEPSYPPTEYHAKDPDPSIRAFRDEVLKHARSGKPLVDVRSPGEFTGQLLHMPDYPQEGALRGGHIPGAVNIPWGKAAKEDGTFKSPKELEQLYLKDGGLKRGARIVAYCRIGERSSHTWFVLKYLLGFRNVKNYDGSWTEWGNAVGLPVERGPGAVAPTEPSSFVPSAPPQPIAETPKPEPVAHAAG